MRHAIFLIITLVALCLGLNMRYYNATQRVLHADEAEQSYVLKKLVVDGDYKYDSQGAHGPTLYYYSAFVDFFKSNAKILTNELRLEVCFFWILCVGLMCLALKNFYAILACIICMSLSGIMSIYSVYYIQEMSFAFLVFALALGIWNFINKPNLFKACILGVLLALTQATKETSIIAYFSIFVSLLVVFLSDKAWRNKLFWHIHNLSSLAKYFLGFGLSFAIVFCAFYSSFGKNPQGILDAFYSYIHFYEKAGMAEHSSDLFYYIKLLLLQKSEGVFFGEIFITILFLIGADFAFNGLGAKIYYKIFDIKRNPNKEMFFRYLTIFAVSNILILSLITYKTPWLILSAMVFMCAVSAYGVEQIFKIPSKALSNIFIVLIIGVIFFQYKLTSNALVRYHSDSRNPFLYAHTVSDLYNLNNRLKTCMDKYNVNIAVISKHSVWPLPWLLDDYDCVGYWAKNTPENLNEFEIVVCDDVSEKDVLNKLNVDEYIQEYYGLRKNLILKAYIKKDIFNKLITQD